MKILHVAKFYPPAAGGMERALGQLCAATSSKWDITVVAAHDRHRTLIEECDGVRVIRTATLGRLCSMPLCPTFPFHIWRDRYDCVVLHEPNPLGAAALLAHTPSDRLVIWHHSDLVRQRCTSRIYSRLQQVLYRRAECVIVSSAALASRSPLVTNARSVAVIPFGIDPEKHSVDCPRLQALVSQIRHRYPGPRLLFVGRLVYYKGVDVLLEAFAECRGSLLIVGTGPLERTLRQTAVDKRIDDRVHFLSHVPDEDLAAYYRAADLFVLPSTHRTEAFGIVQLEAMACSLPVVSTDLPTGVPWVNQHGTTGLVVPPGDPVALAHALKRLGRDAALRASFGAAGKRRVAQMFSVQHMVDAFKGLIRHVVLSPAGQTRLALRDQVAQIAPAHSGQLGPRTAWDRHIARQLSAR